MSREKPKWFEGSLVLRMWNIFIFQPKGSQSAADPKSSLKVKGHFEVANVMNGVAVMTYLDVTIAAAWIRLEGGKVFVNGTDVSDALPYTTPHLYIKRPTSLFVSITGFAFEIIYGYQQLYITLSPYFSSKVRSFSGICRFLTSEKI